MSKKYTILSYILVIHLIIYIFSPFYLYKQKSIAQETTISPSLSGGYAHSMMVKSDGSVWAWGYNQFGELGNGNYTNSYVPVRIDPAKFGNEKVIKTESSSIFNIALTEGKNVYTWGNYQNYPLKVNLGFPVRDIEVAGGDVNNIHYYYSVINDNDGSVWSWGSNFHGGFGNGLSRYSGGNQCKPNYTVGDTSKMQALTSAQLETCPDSPTLKRIVPGTEVPLQDVKQLSVNPYFRMYSIALTNTNEVYIWGEGYEAFATKNPNLSSLSIEKVIAGPVPLVLTTDGKVYRWVGSTGTPIEVKLNGSSEKIMDVSSTNDAMYFLTESKTVYGYGTNSYFEMGANIGQTEVTIANNIAKPIGVNHVESMGAGKDFVLFYKSDGGVTGLGRNNYGQLSSQQDNSRTTFTKIPTDEPMKIVSIRDKTSMSIGVSDTLYTWGSNYDNSLAISSGRTSSFTNIPKPVMNFTSQGGVVAMRGLSKSGIHQGILTGNGKIFNWGNTHRIGTGGGGSNGIIKELTNKNENLTLPSSTFIDMEQSMYNGYGISNDGKVYSWGFDSNGALGTGSFIMGLDDSGSIMTSAGALAFQNVALPSNMKFIDVTASNYTGYTLSDTGKVYSWGNYAYGKLGYTIANNTPIPTLISTLPDIKKIVAGYDYMTALDQNGDIWVWGYNGYGQLGLGHTKNITNPTKIGSLSNVKDIFPGNETTFAITTDGKLYGWGRNQYGQLGLGDRVDRNAPRLIPIENIVTLSAGKENTIVINKDGDMYTTGSDSFGQLGLGQIEGLSEETPIIFTPVLNLTTPDNQTFEQGQAFRLAGDVYTETPNIQTTISYKIESSSGTHTGIIEDYISTQGNHPFSYTIPLDENYPINGYTAFVTVQTSNGLSTTQAVNFGIMDKTPPSVSVDTSNQPVWKTTPVTVNISANDTGGSGYRGVNYAWSTSTTKPLTGWSGVLSNTQIQTSQNNTGKWYLHAESFDNAGNSTYKMFGPYQIDKDGPSIHVTYPLEWQQNNLDMKIDIQDEFQSVSVKKWMEGIVDEQTIKKDGKIIDFTSKTVNKNTSFTFYAEDSLGNTSLQHATISTINTPPTMKNTLQNQIIPFSKKELTLEVETEEYDIGDTLTFVFQIDNGTENEIILGKTNATNQTFSVLLPMDRIPVNKNTTITYYIKDNKQGETAKKTFQLEHYQANTQIATTNVLEHTLSWNPSILGEEYILKRNEETIYEGTKTSFIDASIQNNQTYKYELFVKIGNEVKKVEELQNDSGVFDIQIPKTLYFDTITLKQNQTIYQTDGHFSEDVTFTNTTSLQQQWNVHMNVKPFISKTNPLFQLENSALKIHIPNVILDNGRTLETKKDYIVDYENDVSIFTLTTEQAKGTLTLPISNEKAELQIPFSSVMDKGDQIFQTTIEWKFINAP